MKKLWIFAGRSVYWLLVPLLFIYLRLRTRSRVLVITEGKVLVVKTWLGDGLWTLPGGGLHRGELPANGASRELKEETGVSTKPEQLKSLGEGRQKQNGLNFAYHLFFVVLPKQLSIHKQKPEIIEAKWMEIDELSDDNSQTHLLHALSSWRHHS